MKYHTLITGASTGIGKAIALDFAERGDNLVLVARSGELLEKLAAQLRSAHGIDVRVCVQDLGNAEGPTNVFRFCREEGLVIDRLVNCAGFSVAGDFFQQPSDDLLQMAMVNMVAVAGLTRLFLPGMFERGRGAVINIASMAGFQGVPGMAFYSATKSFVVNLTEALHEEVRGTGVRVFAVCPGFIDNENFYSRAGHNRKKILIPISSPDVVVRAVQRGLVSRSITVIPTLLDRILAFTQRFLPRKPVVRLAGFFAGAREIS